MEININTAQISGEFSKKIFLEVSNKNELLKSVGCLLNNGHQFKGDINNYELAKNGAIVLLANTLMMWGRIQVLPNTVARRNKLRLLGYKEAKLIQ